MTQEPLVSIITPCYNHERFIEQCIESVISQTYENWEMIVVDDCSQDRSPEIVEEYASREPCIHLIRHRDNYGAEGLVKTYNEALDASSGELIAILEGDDFWAPCKLRVQVPAFEDESVVLVYSDWIEITDGGTPIMRYRVGVDHGSLTTRAQENIKFFSHLKSFGANTVIVRKTPLLNIGGFVSAGIPAVDFPTWLRLSLEGQFVRVPLSLACWRRHAGSVYFKNWDEISEGAARFLRGFLLDNRERIEQLGLNVENLYRNAEEMLRWRQTAAPYFEGKYQLVFDNNGAARRRFAQTLLSPNTLLRHRIAASVGIVSTFTSKKLLLALSNIRMPFTQRS